MFTDKCCMLLSHAIPSHIMRRAMRALADARRAWGLAHALAKDARCDAASISFEEAKESVGRFTHVGSAAASAPKINTTQLWVGIIADGGAQAPNNV